MESDVSKLQRDRQGHISTGVVYLFILCCYGALGPPELWAQGRNRDQAAIEVTEPAVPTQEGEASRVPPIALSERRALQREAQPPVEAGRTDLRQERLLQAQLTVTDLRSRLSELRERRRALQREFQPAAGAGRLDLAGEERLQAELERPELAQSEMAAVEAWLEAKEIEVNVLQQTQELNEYYESMFGSEERVTPVKQVADARHLVALTEGVEDGLLELMDAWGSARDSYTQHLEVLDRAIEDSKTRNVNEEVRQLLADQANRARQEIAILQQQADPATQRSEYLLNRQVPLANERLQVAEQRLKTEPKPPQPAATQSTRVLPEDATVDELRRESERAEAEARLVVEEARVLWEEAQMATALAASKKKEKGRYEWDLEFTRTELGRLEREQAPDDDIAAAKARIDSLQGTVDSAQESLSVLNGWVQATGHRAREKELHAESARRAAADATVRLDNGMRRIRNSRIISFAMASFFAAITIGLATLVRRLLRTKEFRSVPDAEKDKQRYTPYLLIRRTAVPVIVFVGTLLILLQFETFQRIGVTILASAGLVSLVVGFAARDVLANTVAGVTLCLSRPIRVGDTVKIGDEYGTIEDIGLLYTRFCTWDGRRVMIPNEILSKKEIVNYTLGDQKIRTKVPIHLDYAADVKKARSIIIDVVKESRNWNRQGEPDIWFKELGQQTITLWVAAWADDPGKAWDLSCDILDNALDRFKQEGIALPRRRYQYDDPKTVFESGAVAASGTRERDEDSGASRVAQIDAPIFPRRGPST